jgi:hypothetical protein
MGSDNAPESDNGECLLRTFLMQLGLMWNDLPWLIQPDPDPNEASTSASASASTQHPFTDPSAPPPLAVLVHLIEQYVALTPHQALACALWAMHTHIYSRCPITPRLYITSPLPNCGKSTLMKVLKHLVARPSMHDNITTAALFSCDRREPQQHIPVG